MQRTLAAAALLLPLALSAQRRPREELARPAALRVDTAAYSRLRWRHIGPEGNRVTSVAGVAGDLNTYYAGSASGGLFKTTDGGIHWTPMTDSLPVASIGAIAVAPSDPNVVYIGTGEPFIRSHISAGWGMFKSTDAGRHWTRAGLESTGRISRIVVDPRDPDRVYAGALGFAYGPQPDRGVFRTTDGGGTWQKVLYVNDSTGVSDLVMDPSNPRVLFAGTWQIEIHTWGRTSGGRGSGLWTSRDGGTTWTRITGHGLPETPVGKVGLGMSKANPNRIYALIEAGDCTPLPNGEATACGRLWRSDDGGASWQLVNSDYQLAGRTHYYNRFGVMPDNANEAYFLSAHWAKTLDAGQTVIDPPQSETPGGDHHDIWIDPTNGNRLIVSHDGGVSISQNRGRSWLQVQLPIAQMYHVTVDNQIPYNLYGNRQDGPSAMCPSNPRISFAEAYSSNVPRGLCRTVGGGESGWATPDTVDGNLVWSSASGWGSVGGIATLWDRRTNMSHSLDIWPLSTIGWSADSLRYRFVWTFPLTISPHDHNMVYVGSQYVHVTTDSGRTWREISPDLTRNDKARQGRSGGLTPDNIGVEYAGVVHAIAESPIERGLIWAGTNDGLVHVTRDGGRTWTNVTRNLPGLFPWGTVSSITPSRFAAGTTYLTVDAHQVDNRDPWVYRTTDYGATWRLITAGVPRSPLSYAHSIAEDPAVRGLLYLGTENGMYVSFDDGERWQPLQTNLPHAPVYWITVQPRYGDLAVATYGRGMWILDDVGPLRELARGAPSGRVHLFTPRETFRLRDSEQPFAVYDDPTAGQIPPSGAPITYWVGKADAKSTVGAQRSAADSQPKAAVDSATVTIADASGAVIRTMKGPIEPGVNRVWWNLRADRSREARLRTSPEYASWLAVGPQGRTAPGVGRLSLLVPPGSYTVKLAYGGVEETRPVVVRKDPSSGGSEAEVVAQYALLRSIRADLDSAVAMLNALELVRGQLAALRTLPAADSTHPDVRAAADTLDRRALAAERRLFQTRITGRGQDDVRWPMRIAEQLVYLGEEIGGSDYGPTQSQREVATLLHTQLGAVAGDVARVLGADLAAFNELLRRKGLSNVVADQ
ncbi:MAG: sialidase [Gemmatimonadaceae bacterium]